MSKSPTKFALFGNSHQEARATELCNLIKALKGRKASITIERRFHDYIVNKLGIDASDIETFDEICPEVDIAVSVGGDGTFLRTAKLIAQRDIPILGINTGRLGFLSDIPSNEIYATIDCICNGDYRVEERANLHIECEGYEDYPYALNEIAVLKHDIASMINIDVEINGELITTYWADGLIICTPTGSTAYSLSNGGPILVPQLNSFCITPVAPHSLNIRPIVVSDSSVITLHTESRSGSFLVAVDGRNAQCKNHTKLTLRKADRTTKVVKINNKTFFHTLKEKLMWGADVRK